MRSVTNRVCAICRLVWPAAASWATRSSLGVSASRPRTASRRGRPPAMTSSALARAASSALPSPCAMSRPSRSRSRATARLPARRCAAPRSISARASSSGAGDGRSTATASVSSSRPRSPPATRPAARSATPSARPAPQRRASATSESHSATAVRASPSALSDSAASERQAIMAGLLMPHRSARCPAASRSAAAAACWPAAACRAPLACRTTTNGQVGPSSPARPRPVSTACATASSLRAARAGTRNAAAIEEIHTSPEPARACCP